MKKLFAAALATGSIFLGMNGLAQAASTADVVFVVDESGSMSGEHGWIQNMVTALDTALIGAGVTSNRYALVGFGDGSIVAGHSYTVGSGTWGTAADLASSASTNLKINGGTEDGYSGINVGATFTFRSDAAVNYILITDEDRDNYNNSLTYNSMLAQFATQKALLNAVVNAEYSDGALGMDADGDSYLADGLGGYNTGTGASVSYAYGTTLGDYMDLAWATGGAAWDLNLLRAGGLTADSFTKAFVDIKVNEIVNQEPINNPVPEPTTMVLFGAGLAGLAAMGRRQTKK